MGTKLRVLVFLLAAVSSFIALANTATVFHGAVFVCLVLPWGIAVSRLFDWVKS